MPDSFLIGHGYDIHRFKDGGELTLGGVVVAKGMSVIAHSDGDVVVHAVIDAVLGAPGRGDIGHHFPDTDQRFKGAAGSVFLEKIAEILEADGFKIVNCDVTILTERPKLAPFKQQMATFLRGALGGKFNIKAGTNEGCDAVGRGEAIAAHAVVLLVSSDSLESPRPS